ncbi:hypothetical protein IJ102_00055 [Candidatus Saccharibacteria bacterium]|nr:hypothetical protein [Candidatus Saccharibacteria bacterium]
MKNTLKGKNILITQSALRVIAGSEIVALELAEALQKKGANVRIFTWEYGTPIMQYVQQKNIRVTCNERDPFFKKCDYIWVHHQVLPELVIEELFKNSSYSPRIMFMHMSGLPTNHIEQPYINGLEKRISDKSYYVSTEAKNLIEQMFYSSNTPVESGLFQNYFPVRFADKQYSRRELKKILVVSNHPPQEVIELRSLSGSISITYMGEKNKDYKMITPEIILAHDAVISIGKTVQYCLACGVPVYIYDKFGGCGYLTRRNFAKNENKNFSGRGYKKKSAPQIMRELISGYDEARTHQAAIKDSMIKKFCLDDKLLDIFKPLSKQKTIDAELYYPTIATMSMAKWKLKGDFYVKELKDIINIRDTEIRMLRQNSRNLESKIQGFKNSRTYKIVTAINRFIGKNTGL